DADAPRVSGSLKAHYAPQTPLHVLPLETLLQKARLVSGSGQRIAAIVFEPEACAGLPGVEFLPAAAGPVAYAHGLYAMLRRLDRAGYDRILLEQPPLNAAWQAVNDRIGRAAAAFNTP